MTGWLFFFVFVFIFLFCFIAFEYNLSFLRSITSITGCLVKVHTFCCTHNNVCFSYQLYAFWFTEIVIDYNLIKSVFRTVGFLGYKPTDSNFWTRPKMQWDVGHCLLLDPVWSYKEKQNKCWYQCNATLYSSRFSPVMHSFARGFSSRKNIAFGLICWHGRWHNTEINN